MSTAGPPLTARATPAGRRAGGAARGGAPARARHARLLLVASDAAANTRRRCAHFAEAGAVPWAELPFTKEELGGTVGRSSCALAAVTDIGFASSLAAKLSALNPERYGDLAAALDVKAQKALQRQKEQRQHEKNLREGKRKPWAPPPVEKKTGSASHKAPVRVSPPPPGRPKAPRGKITIKFRPGRDPKPRT